MTRSPESSSLSVQFCTELIVGATGYGMGVARQKRPDEGILPPPVEPDRTSFPAFELEAAALGDSLRRVVLGVRPNLDPPHSGLDQIRAHQLDRTRDEPSPAAGLGGEVRELPVVTVALGSDHGPDDGVGERR